MKEQHHQTFTPIGTIKIPKSIQKLWICGSTLSFLWTKPLDKLQLQWKNIVAENEVKSNPFEGRLLPTSDSERAIWFFTSVLPSFRLIHCNMHKF